MYTYIHTFVYTYIHTYIYVYIYYIYIYIYIDIPKYINIYIGEGGDDMGRVQEPGPVKRVVGACGDRESAGPAGIQLHRSITTFHCLFKSMCRICS